MDTGNGFRAGRHAVLTVETQASGAACTVRLVGDLDFESAGLLLEAVSRTCQDGCQALTLDLSRLSFCDVRGLRALMQARSMCEAGGGRLALDGAAGIVRRLLLLSGVEVADGPGDLDGSLSMDE